MGHQEAHKRQPRSFSGGELSDHVGTPRWVVTRPTALAAAISAPKLWAGLPGRQGHPRERLRTEGIGEPALIDQANHAE
jgi:hypothetical protein